MSKREKRPMKYKNVRRLRGVLIGVEILIIAIFVLLGVIYKVPSLRNQAIKYVARTSIGKSIAGMFVAEDFESNVQDKDFNEEEIVTSDEVKKADIGDYKQILLIGIDARGDEMDDSTNSDSMIVLTINTKTGSVKMTSIYRDTYLEIYGSDGTSLGYRRKVNSAYANQGIQGCINTLNMNLDLNISDYVVLNFTGVTKVIDALGGVTVNLSQEEIYQLNQHLADTKLNTGLYAPNVTKVGKNKLVGLQATTYMRIRKAAFTDPKTGEVITDDYGRAARQQYIIKKLVRKVKKAGLQAALDTIEVILSENTEQNRILKTSMSFDEIMELVPTVFDFSLDGGQGFPSKISSASIGGQDMVVPTGLTYNVYALHEFLGYETNYQVSSTVERISESIAYETGIFQLEWTGTALEEETEASLSSNESVDVSSADSSQDSYTTSQDPTEDELGIVK